MEVCALTEGEEKGVRRSLCVADGWLKSTPYCLLDEDAQYLVNEREEEEQVDN